MLALSASAGAQLAINEVLIDPVGPNAGNQVVELVNTGTMPFDPTGWSFCLRPSYPPMPSIVIPAGGIVRVQDGFNEIAVPYFNKIPFLGYMFRTREWSDERQEILIFMTPQIVRN